MEGAFIFRQKIRHCLRALSKAKGRPGAFIQEHIRPASEVKQRLQHSAAHGQGLVAGGHAAGIAQGAQ